jgi:hypothetical protein
LNRSLTPFTPILCSSYIHTLLLPPPTSVCLPQAKERRPSPNPESEYTSFITSLSPILIQPHPPSSFPPLRHHPAALHCCGAYHVEMSPTDSRSSQPTAGSRDYPATCCPRCHTFLHVMQTPFMCVSRSYKRMTVLMLVGMRR